MNRFGLKLVSLALAVLFWIQVAASHSEVRTVALPLRLTGLPAGLTLAGNRLPERIRVRGRSSKLNFLANRLFRRSLGEVVVRLDDAHAGVRFERSLSPADVRTSLDEVSIEPPVVLAFTVDTLLVRRLPVMPELRGKLPGDRLLAGPVTVDPDTATVRGPGRFLAAAETVRTTPVDLSRIRQTVRVKRELLPPVAAAEVTPEEAVVTVPVAERRERLLAQLPVVPLLDSGMRGVDVYPPVVSVRVSGPADSLAGLGPADVAVTVSTSGLEPGEHTLRPAVLVPPPFRVEAVVPDAVTVVIGRERETGGG